MNPFRWRGLAAWLFGLVVVPLVEAEEHSLVKQFPHVQAILARHCQSCHAGEKHEGELDLEQYPTMDEVRVGIKLWQQIANVVRQGDMPPPESPALSAADRSTLIEWIDGVIQAELKQSAGDPGPTILRRLNSAEYTYTVQDLTGVPLQPATEFPSEGAAGEGFINAGESLSMSPALLQKHLDAAKWIAAHAVLTPNGFRFSLSDSRRDWEEELLQPIREIYARHTTGRTDAHYLDQWSGDPRRLLENDGRVDLIPYFSALLANRQELKTNWQCADQIAKANGLNPKYLLKMAETLCSSSPQSELIESWRQVWRQNQSVDPAEWAKQVQAWQSQLWKFQSVSHLGLIQPWQAPVSPLQSTLHIQQPLAAAPNGTSNQLEIAVGCAGDGDVGDQVVIVRPRIEYPDHPPVQLRDLPQLAKRIQWLQQTELPRLHSYLGAIESQSRSASNSSASELSLRPDLLERLSKLLNLGSPKRPVLNGHFKNRHPQVSGQPAIQGWSTDDLPVILANQSDQAVRFSTLTIPAHSVTLHPTPDRAAAIGWQCPHAGDYRIELRVTDQDNHCGNGIAWSLQRWADASTSSTAFASGEIDGGAQASWTTDQPTRFAQGELLQIVISARNRDHVCDTTGVHLIIHSMANRQTWNLADDVADDLLAGNPHKDSFGNDDVWHFFSPGDTTVQSPIPSGSTLAKWRQAVRENQDSSLTESLAKQIAAQLVAPEVSNLSAADQEARKLLLDWRGPLDWLAIATSQAFVAEIKPEIDVDQRLDAPFGPHDGAAAMDPNSMMITAPYVWSCPVPNELANGGQVVFDVHLADPRSAVGSVQVHCSTKAVSQVEPQTDKLRLLTANAAILIGENAAAKARWERAFADFRSLFPAALCHAQIVPIDAVVTLVLFHREDEPLQRLMLSDDETARLNQLWDELHFVSEDALRMEVSLEQILEFSTQDADPRFFDPVRQPIADHAAEFRKTKLAAEPKQLEWLLGFTARAYRRPLTDAEADRLRSLYQSLRDQSLEHDAAIRMLIARALVSSAFLYRMETAGQQAEPSPIPPTQLATRFSYFLWSSMPDETLLSLADDGALLDSSIQQQQVTRMLQDPRARRLAVEFFCQWMHLRDFDQHNEKSEKAFPQFSSLREPMYEESIQFFTHLIQQNGSILDLLDCDYAFLNESMALHYDIPDVQGAAWRRVDDVRRLGRGGILTQAAILSSQSGASRTSPVLRGNWITETLLGERLPKPPKDVPVIPDGDDSVQTLTVRQLVERHTADAACAKCHQRIDPYGLALERYDAIGRRRELDAGQPINDSARLPDGTEIAGLTGIQNYLTQQRKEQFVRQFCRKLLGFALGRSLVLGDESLLQKMESDLKQNDYRFAVAVNSIVQSHSFQMIRGRDYHASSLP